MDFQLDHVCTLIFWCEYRVYLHILHNLLRISEVVIRWSHSESVNELDVFFPDSLFLFVSSWSHSHHYLWVSCNVARYLSAVFYRHPLRVLAGSGLWLLQDWGWRDEAAFNQQLAPHKAFITPKRLRLPKPEWDKHCPFICNDMEARSNWSELRGKG